MLLVENWFVIFRFWFFKYKSSKSGCLIENKFLRLCDLKPWHIMYMIYIYLYDIIVDLVKSE